MVSGEQELHYFKASDENLRIYHQLEALEASQHSELPAFSYVKKVAELNPETKPSVVRVKAGHTVLIPAGCPKMLC